jgi:hypothetical protein
MNIPNIKTCIEESIIELAEEMDGHLYMESNAMRIVNFELPDGRLVQAQLILQTDEYEFIGE